MIHWGRFLNRGNAVLEPLFIFGLGNPGREYENTRHNIGFLAVDTLSTQWSIGISKLRFQSLVGEGKFHDNRIYLIKPQTYMNNSGNAVRSFLKFYKARPDRILIILDDLDLPFARIRIRKGGGSAGHKGMESVITKIGTDEFARLRIGIGRPPGRMDPMDYVLKKFPNKSKSALEFVLSNVTDSIEVIIVDGIEKAMTSYNHPIMLDD
jgi:PTH1 family peptidyl-tRNA hydrolase